MSPAPTDARRPGQLKRTTAASRPGLGSRAAAGGRPPVGSRWVRAQRPESATGALPLPPPPPPPPAEPGLEPAVRAAPTGPSSSRSAQTASRRSGPSGHTARWLWWPVVAITVVSLAAMGGGSRTPPPPTPDATDTASEADEQETIDEPRALDALLPPIDLAPPHGTAPRTRPLQTVWILDEDLTDDPAIVAVVREEVELAVEYLAQWSMPGDGLAIGRGTPRRVASATSELAAAAAQPVTEPMPSPPALQEVQRSLGAFPDDHTSVLVLSTDPSASSALLQPTTNEVDDERGASQQRFLIRLDAGVGSDAALRANEPLPSRVTVDPTVRGDLATVLARSWVQSYGGGWTDGR